MQIKYSQMESSLHNKESEINNLKIIQQAKIDEVKSNHERELEQISIKVKQTIAKKDKSYMELNQMYNELLQEKNAIEESVNDLTKRLVLK